jgi:hypothetical protein
MNEWDIGVLVGHLMVSADPPMRQPASNSTIVRLAVHPHPGINAATAVADKIEVCTSPA